MGWQKLICVGAIGVILAAGAERAFGQKSADSQASEQTVFEAEADSPVKQPVKIPDSALQVLMDTLTGGTFNCLKSMGATPEQAPVSWFLASEIHLNGPDEIDLIVVPNVANIANPKNPGGCLLAAHGGPFWVLGPGIASGRYELLLATHGLGMEVLDSRTNRYRDIQVGEERSDVLYKFSWQQYQPAERTTAP